MDLGDKVKYCAGDIDYLGIIVGIDHSGDKTVYMVSLMAKGVVVKTDGTAKGGGRLIALE